MTTTILARCPHPGCTAAFTLATDQVLMIGDELVSIRVDTTEMEAHMVVHEAEGVLGEDR